MSKKESCYQTMEPSIKLMLDRGANNIVKIMEVNNELRAENRDLKAMIEVLKFEIEAERRGG